MNLTNFTIGITLIITALYFQLISKHAYYLEIAHLVFVIYLLIHSLLILPESPRYNYSKQQYAKAKEGLAYIARYNGITNYN